MLTGWARWCWTGWGAPATEAELRDSGRGLATLTALDGGPAFGGAAPGAGPGAAAFELEGIDFVFLDRQADPGQPQGIGADHFDLDRLLAGETLSGHDGRTVYALAPASRSARARWSPC